MNVVRLSERDMVLCRLLNGERSEWVLMGGVRVNLDEECVCEP
jgi:hypothetical protein